MRNFFAFLFLLATTVVRAQNPGFCSNCSWESEGFNSVWEDYVISDTTAARMKVSSVRITVTRDTLSAGYSMHPTNNTSCNDCRLVRYDAKGREEFVFYNHPDAMNGKLLKKQYVYDEQGRPKYILDFEKDPGAEYDTSYTLAFYTLVTYGDKISTSKKYTAESGFAVAPKQAPVSISTKTFDTQGRILSQKTVYPTYGNRNDSTSFQYTKEGNTIYRVYAGKLLVYSSHSRNENNRTIEMYDTTFAGQRSYVSSYYTYDAQGRLTKVASHGNEQLQRFCGGELGTEVTIKYDKNGLPLLLIFRGRNDYCALAFHYTYQQ